MSGASTDLRVCVLYFVSVGLKIVSGTVPSFDGPAFAMAGNDGYLELHFLSWLQEVAELHRSPVVHAVQAQFYRQPESVVMDHPVVHVDVTRNIACKVDIA